MSEEEHPFTVDQPGLFACYQAAALGVGVSGERAGQPTLRSSREKGTASTDAKRRVDGRTFLCPSQTEKSHAFNRTLQSTLCHDAPRDA